MAGACGATAQNLRKMLVGELPDAKCMIAEVLARRGPRIERLLGLALEKIHEALGACEIDKDEGAERIDRPDHLTRRLAVGPFCRLVRSLLEQK